MNDKYLGWLLHIGGGLLVSFNVAIDSTHGA